jgi:hypothetical protein
MKSEGGEMGGACSVDEKYIQTLKEKDQLEDVGIFRRTMLLFLFMEWYRSRRPIHCNNYSSFVLPRLGCNHS